MLLVGTILKKYIKFLNKISPIKQPPINVLKLFADIRIFITNNLNDKEYVHTLVLCENPITPCFVAVYTDWLALIGNIPEEKTICL